MQFVYIFLFVWYTENNKREIVGTKKINSSRLKILYKVNEDIINKMIELDETVFKEEDRGTLEGCKKWLKCNPDIYTVLLYDDEVIGYINFNQKTL